MIAATWEVALCVQRLSTLQESRDLYRSALKHLLGDEWPDALKRVD